LKTARRKAAQSRCKVPAEAGKLEIEVSEQTRRPHPETSADDPIRHTHPRSCVMPKRFIAAVLLLALGVAPGLIEAQPLPALPYAEKLDEHRSSLDTFMLRGPLDLQTSDRSADAWLRLEGSSVLSYYRLQPEAATLQVLRDYQRALISTGFEVLFSCETSDGSCYQPHPRLGKDTAPYAFAQALDRQPELPRLEGDYIRNYFGNRARYLLAARAEAETHSRRYLSLALAEHSRGNHAFLREVAVELPSVAADTRGAADALLSTLQRDGRSLLRGLRFQPGNAQLQLGGDGALAELASLMHANPALRLTIEAEADRDTPAGEVEALALQRAQTLVSAMAQGEGVAASRLQARAGSSVTASGADARVQLILLEPIRRAQ